MKKLVLFYSLDGNTMEAAQKIANALDADICRIDTAKPLSKNRTLKIMTGGMYVTFGICPKLKPLECDLSEYDEIIIGVPVWAGKCAAPMLDVIKKNNIGDKVKAVFTFSGSGNNQDCTAQLSQLLNGIEVTASLIDKTCSGSENNAQKLDEFIEKITK